MCIGGGESCVSGPTWLPRSIGQKDDECMCANGTNRYNKPKGWGLLRVLACISDRITFLRFKGVNECHSRTAIGDRFFVYRKHLPTL